MWYLQHRLFAQVVQLLSDGAFTCMDEGSQHKSNSLSRACRRNNVTRCPISCLLLCATRNRHNPAGATKEKRRKCTSARAAGVHVYPMTPSGRQEEQTSGICTRSTLESIPICEGAAELFMPLRQEAFLKSSSKIA